MLKQSSIKIQQASDFLKLAIESFKVKDHRALKNNLEAFIAFGRSALHMIFKDLTDTSRRFRDQDDLNKFVELGTWTEKKYKQVKEDNLAMFFIDRRNYILKQGTLELILHIQLEDTAKVTEEISITRQDSKGNLIDTTKSEPRIDEHSNIQLDSTQKLFFKDWENEEDVFDLCNKYLDRLSALYSEAQEYLKSI